MKIADRSDLFQVFKEDDILGAPQAIKGFDKPDLYELFSIYQRFLAIEILIRVVQKMGAGQGQTNIGPPILIID